MTPFKIRVGFGDVRVIPEEHHFVRGTPAAGSWEAATRTITLATSEHLADQAVTLVHEILHAIWSTYDLPESLGDEEAIVVALSGPLASAIRDNPEVFAMIDHSLNHGTALFGPPIH